jgi:hypothetical protein
MAVHPGRVLVSVMMRQVSMALSAVRRYTIILLSAHLAGNL